MLGGSGPAAIRGTAEPDPGSPLATTGEPKPATGEGVCCATAATGGPTSATEAVPEVTCYREPCWSWGG